MTVLALALGYLVFHLLVALIWVIVKEKYNDDDVLALLCWPFYLPLSWVARVISKR